MAKIPTITGVAGRQPLRVDVPSAVVSVPTPTGGLIAARGLASLGGEITEFGQKVLRLERTRIRNGFENDLLLLRQKAEEAALAADPNDAPQAFIGVMDTARATAAGFEDAEDRNFAESTLDRITTVGVIGVRRTSIKRLSALGLQETSTFVTNQLQAYQASETDAQRAEIVAMVRRRFDEDLDNLIITRAGWEESNRRFNAAVTEIENNQVLADTKSAMDGIVVSYQTVSAKDRPGLQEGYNDLVDILLKQGIINAVQKQAMRDDFLPLVQSMAEDTIREMDARAAEHQAAGDPNSIIDLIDPMSKLPPSVQRDTGILRLRNRAIKAKESRSASDIVEMAVTGQKPLPKGLVPSDDTKDNAYKGLREFMTVDRIIRGHINAGISLPPALLKELSDLVSGPLSEEDLNSVFSAFRVLRFLDPQVAEVIIRNVGDKTGVFGSPVARVLYHATRPGAPVGEGESIISALLNPNAPKHLGDLTTFLRGGKIGEDVIRARDIHADINAALSAVGKPGLKSVTATVRDSLDEAFLARGLLAAVFNNATDVKGFVEEAAKNAAVDTLSNFVPIVIRPTKLFGFFQGETVLMRKPPEIDISEVEGGAELFFKNISTAVLEAITIREPGPRLPDPGLAITSTASLEPRPDFAFAFGEEIAIPFGFNGKPVRFLLAHSKTGKMRIIESDGKEFPVLLGKATTDRSSFEWTPFQAFMRREADGDTPFTESQSFILMSTLNPVSGKNQWHDQFETRYGRKFTGTEQDIEDMKSLIANFAGNTKWKRVDRTTP